MTGDVIGIADIRPGLRVEITQRPWRGVLTTGVEPGGRFFAVRDGADDGVVTSWSVDAVGSIRCLPDPLPTTPGERFWGKTAKTTPQWWFVRFSLNHPGYGLRYAPQTEEDVAREMSAEAAAFEGLVCLPDPEQQQ